MENNFRVILAKQCKRVSDVYRATGISRNTLTNLYYERAKNLELKTLLKITDYLGVILDELLKSEN